MCIECFYMTYIICFFFFKQKTAYEMRISDWSSDVCSSDLARHRGIPRPVILAMLSRHAGSCAIRPAENHGTAHLAARHIICFGRRVNDMIDRLHGEVEGHEFDDRPQTTHRRAGPKARKTIRSEEHTSELQSLMRISYAVFCWKKKK